MEQFAQQQNNNWQSKVTSFPRVILQCAEKELASNGYSQFEFLANGVQGIILKAYSETDGKTVSINIQSKNQIEYQTVKGEYDTLINLKDSKYIVKYLRVLYFEDIFICAIVSEYFNLSIQDEIQEFRQTGRWFDDDTLSTAVINLCSIVQELHKYRITHFNIDPSKIVKSPEEGVYKISDLSFSIALKTDRQAAISFIKSNIRYASPEVDQLSDKDAFSSLSSKADVFSMSLIIFEVLGYPLDDILIKQIQNGHLPQEQIIDGFRFKDLQKLFITSLYNPVVEKRIESYEMINKLCPYLPFSQKGIDKLLENLKQIVAVDPYNDVKNIPYNQNLRVQSKLAQIVIMKTKTKSNEDEIKQAEEDASDYIFTLGDPQQSLNLRLEIIKFYQEKQPENMKKICSLNLKISFCYMKMQENAKALNYSEIAYSQSLGLYEGDSIQTSQCLYVISWSYFGLNQTEKAIEIALKSLEMKRKVYPANDLTIATSLSTLGSMHDKLNKIDLALQFKLESLDIRQHHANIGNKSVYPHLILSYLTLATTYTILKTYQVSIDYHMKALEFRRMIYGQYHPDIIDSLKKIKNVYTYMKNDSEANRIQEEIQQIESNPKYHKQI